MRYQSIALQQILARESSLQPDELETLACQNKFDCGYANYIQFPAVRHNGRYLVGGDPDMLSAMVHYGVTRVFVRVAEENDELASLDDGNFLSSYESIDEVLAAYDQGDLVHKPIE